MANFQLTLSKTDAMLLLFLLGEFMTTCRQADVSEEAQAYRDAAELYDRLLGLIKEGG